MRARRSPVQLLNIRMTKDMRKKMLDLWRSETWTGHRQCMMALQEALNNNLSPGSGMELDRGCESENFCLEVPVGFWVKIRQHLGQTDRQPVSLAYAWCRLAVKIWLDKQRQEQAAAQLDHAS